MAGEGLVRAALLLLAAAMAYAAVWMVWAITDVARTAEVGVIDDEGDED